MMLFLDYIRLKGLSKVCILDKPAYLKQPKTPWCPDKYSLTSIFTWLCTRSSVRDQKEILEVLHSVSQARSLTLLVVSPFVFTPL